MNRSEVIIISIIGLLLSPFIFLLPERASVTLIGLSFIVVMLEKQIRAKGWLLVMVLLSVTAHHLASLINVFYTTLMGADVDAVGFHEAAKLMARSIQPEWFAEFGNMDAGSNIYIRFLALSYRIFGDSKLLGQELSVFAYTLSCILLVKLSRQMGLVRWRVGLMFLYGLLPSSILFISFTLREAYQVLFFLMIAYWTFALRRKPSVGKMIWIGIGGAGLGILHNGLVIYALFLICFSFFWGLGFGLRGWNVKSLGAKIGGVSLLLGIIAIWIFFASNFGGASRAIMSGEGAEYAGVYRERVGTEDRATYGGKLDTSSITTFLPSAATVFVLYMFAPFPWQVNNLVDIYAALEGLLRLLLLYQALKTWYRARGERRSQWGYLILCFFSLEFLWATGTANWGTAVRHHLVAYGLLILIGGPGLLSSLKGIFHRLTRKKRRVRRRIVAIRSRPVPDLGHPQHPLTSPSHLPQTPGS